MKYKYTYKNADEEIVRCDCLIDQKMLQMVICNALKRDLGRPVSKNCYKQIIMYLTRNDDSVIKLITGEYHFEENDDYDYVQDIGGICNGVNIYLMADDSCAPPIEYFIDRCDEVWE